MLAFFVLGLPPFFGGIAFAPVQLLVGGSPATLLMVPFLGPVPTTPFLFL
ncbi:hypothetical protein [Antarcticirhabdus aurantiaca]|uniref:Uncharacterized protein n=1 Tax=Antarcticirhabdus aurantiaca TaxID=2606717 RepID=A0ACD4NTA2_9HYPH|nr:hypothetical protein [Antarcticirhabdus aurantiaca]WAJ30091.1 hypothetical protein OXU80_07760 [Jeongeuplla avenae]